ncbi:hypothetical protein [Nonomuraea endophytica]|uniref:Uncharacterized protein n=1 Tax=Nonomuraea endophytica TaxID=714136 RepID=A0A7W8EMK4_9ACTN|nr:hypothetical protein [Nonomuraea endophytica]MBB5085119.1 hypothetical protein [Nonomuraea endophytica]
MQIQENTPPANQPLRRAWWAATNAWAVLPTAAMPATAVPPVSQPGQDLATAR